MSQRRLFLCGLLLPLLALAACGGGGSDGSGGSGGGEANQGRAGAKPGAKAAPAVAVRDFQFVPKALTVKAATKVTWTNEDASPHVIKDQSELGTPESPQLNQGDTFSITYPKAGTYPYICGIHNYMTGSVEVTD